MNIIETDKFFTYAIGDIHGQFLAIRPWIRDHQLHDCSIIFCGDFGLGFENLEREKIALTKVNEICEKYNIDLYAIRGNHDDPSYYQGTDVFNLSHFKAIPDYTIIKSPTANILCLGGAVSVDRSYRKDSYEREVIHTMAKKHIPENEARKLVKCYHWSDEAFKYDDEKIAEIINSDIDINVICSHTAPSIAYPVTKSGLHYWFQMDPPLQKDIDKEREDMLRVYDRFKDSNKNLEKWIYGHFHSHANEMIEGTNFILLNMGRRSKRDTSGESGGIFDMCVV